jgi:hypothetical protein
MMMKFKKDILFYALAAIKVIVSQIAKKFFNKVK